MKQAESRVFVPPLLAQRFLAYFRNSLHASEQPRSRPTCRRPRYRYRLQGAATHDGRALLHLPRCGTPARRDPTTLALALFVRSERNEMPARLLGTETSVAPRSVPWLSLAIESTVDRLPECADAARTN